MLNIHLKGFKSLEDVKNVSKSNNMLWSKANCMNYSVVSFLNYISQIAKIQVTLLEPIAANTESDTEDIWAMKTTIFNEKLNEIILHVVKYNGVYYYYRKV